MRKHNIISMIINSVIDFKPYKDRDKSKKFRDKISDAVKQFPIEVAKQKQIEKEVISKIELAQLSPLLKKTDFLSPTLLGDYIKGINPIEALYFELNDIRLENPKYILSKKELFFLKIFKDNHSEIKKYLETVIKKLKHIYPIAEKAIVPQYPKQSINRALHHFKNIEIFFNEVKNKTNFKVISLSIKKVDSLINIPEVLSKINVPKYLFHVTPKNRLPSIEKEGLKLNSKRVTKIGSPKGKIFLTNDKYAILDNYEWDNVDAAVLKVETKGLKLKLDPEYYADFVKDLEGLIKFANTKPRIGSNCGLFMYSENSINRKAIKEID